MDFIFILRSFIMIEYVDMLAEQLITLIVPLIGLRILLDYARIILFKE